MRYIPHTDAEIEKMLKAIGLKSLDDLFEHIPQEIREKGKLNLPPPLSHP